MNPSPWRRDFYGMDTKMAIKGGFTRRVYLNNAATSQIARPVIECVNQSLNCYAYDNEPNCISENLRDAYNQVRCTAMEYVHADQEADTAIFTPTTTIAINLLNHILHQADPCQIVLATRMEHMANYLPYRETGQVLLTELTPDGNIDMEDYCQKLTMYAGKIKLVAVTGASNITGVIPPYHRMAELAHEYGALFFLDAVQLVQHHPFDMWPHCEKGHIDFVSFDGHKCYTGQSGGVLIGNKDFLDRYQPLIYGAGITDFVSECQIVYRCAPEKFEAGYPDYLGILSMGRALAYLTDAGIYEIAGYEESLYQYMIERLREIPGLILYGPIDCRPHSPIAAFNMKGMTFQELGKQLGYRCGIAIAYGTCGANLYVQSLLGLSDADAYHAYSCGGNFGLVRASLGMGNSFGDIDRLAQALFQVSRENSCYIK